MKSENKKILKQKVPKPKATEKSFLHKNCEERDIDLNQNIQQDTPSSVHALPGQHYCASTLSPAKPSKSNPTLTTVSPSPSSPKIEINSSTEFGDKLSQPFL